MGLVRNLFKKYDDLIFLKQGLLIQTGILLFGLICNLYHLAIYAESHIIIFFVFNFFYFGFSISNLVQIFFKPEVQTYQNFSHVLCLLYWVAFSFVLNLYLIALTYYRSFGAVANSSFIGVFIFDIFNAIFQVIAFIVLLDLKNTVTSKLSERDCSNFIEDFASNNKNKKVGEVDLDLSGDAPLVRKNSGRQNYTITTEMENIAKASGALEPRIVLNKEKKVVSSSRIKISDENFPSKLQEQLGNSNLLQSEIESDQN